MFELTLGELALVIFLFALAWGAGRVPRIGETLGEWFAAWVGPAANDARDDVHGVRPDER